MAISASIVEERPILWMSTAANTLSAKTPLTNLNKHADGCAVNVLFSFKMSKIIKDDVTDLTVKTPLATLKIFDCPCSEVHISLEIGGGFVRGVFEVNLIEEVVKVPLRGNQIKDNIYLAKERKRRLKREDRGLVSSFVGEDARCCAVLIVMDAEEKGLITPGKVGIS
ncbi:unnamed protein product [Sphenostylis stenocarpa]|uniref:Uncharacterized protein n=1 Tax=Sphenostylis stenocarpa TaxID=92480 RepID=A0AA86RT38_9FABA|nr:unnamed protein product [Sphenostylis stenocarpa]